MLKCGKYIIDTLDATALVSLRYATWLAQNMRAIFLANQMQYRNQSLLGRSRFLALWAVSWFSTICIILICRCDYSCNCLTIPFKKCILSFFPLFRIDTKPYKCYERVFTIYSVDNWIQKDLKPAENRSAVKRKVWLTDAINTKHSGQTFAHTNFILAS